MKKIELSHDIIAEKIWERLPDNDKLLREAERSLKQRVQDYDANKGSLLGAKEIAAWEGFFPQLVSDENILDFVNKSKKYLKREANIRKWLRAGLVLGAIGSFLAALIAFYQNRKAQEALREVVRRDLKEVEELVLRLDYEGSWQKLQEIAAFGVLQDSVSCQMAEPAFFYAEGGQIDRAKGMLDTIAGYTGNKAMLQLLSRWSETDSTVHLSLLRQSVIALDDSVTYKRLQARYYPEMIFLEGRRFMMQGEEFGGDVVAYEAEVSDFSLSKYETTVWQYHLFCAAKGHDISRRISSDGVTFEQRSYRLPWGWVGDNPVVEVTWYDAVVYANWLSEQWGRSPYYEISLEKDSLNTNEYDDFKWTVTPNPKSNGFRLPTELEWEFAAKGGMRQDIFRYSGSHDLREVGWIDDSRTQGVGQKKANGAGIYDMSGNVWEWCYDWYDYLPAPTPLGAEGGSHRVFRGGSWRHDPKFPLVSDRYKLRPYYRLEELGFRLALVP